MLSTSNARSDNEVMTDDQARYVKKNTERVFKLMRETPPDGKEFAASIENVLEREKQWNKWKNEGCPTFNRAANSEEAKTALQRG